MRRKSNSQQAKEACEQWIKGHRLADEVSKSWFLRQQKGGSAYHYNVTWTRGHLMLTGDLEDLSLTHYHAMPTWVDAVLWADGADPHYLLEKSGLRRSYDQEKTFWYIIDACNEEAVPDLRNHRDEVRWWRNEMRDANSPDPLLWSGNDEVGPVWLERPGRPGMEMRWVGDRYSTSGARLPVVPEAWQKWDKLRQALHSLMDEKDIFTRAGRSYIMNELEEELARGESNAYQIIGEVTGWDDASPCYDYTFHQYLSARAIVHWAAVVKETDEFKQAHQRMLDIEELATQSFALDRRMPYHKYDHPQYRFLPGVIGMINHG